MGKSCQTFAGLKQGTGLKHIEITRLRLPRLASRLASVASLTVIAVFTTGCSDSLPSLPKIGDLNPFAEKQVPLAGKRVAVLEVSDKVGGELATADRPIILPPARANETWTQPGGPPNNAPGHLALASVVRPVWSADAGTGSTTAGRLTASPIVADGRVYTLDAAAHVSAFAISGGSAVWRANLTPEKQKAEKGYGGGIAADMTRIYAATGFGTVVALDQASGKKLWEKDLGVPIRSSITAAADRVFVLTVEGRFYCLNGASGEEVWSFRGLLEKTSLISNPSPAVDGDMVVVPYPTGEVVAIKISTGQPAWTESLARNRSASAIASMSDAARPAIDGGTVFAVGHGGKLVAVQQKNGERLWSLNVPSTQTPWVAGDIVFVADTNGQLLAITRKDGKVLWTIKLPGTSAWTGPTLAGGLLWLASQKGQLVAVEAATGKIASSQELGAPVFIAPIVAQGRMFIMTDKAKLIALGG
jgi:outer membrane protein assembly factor BamB